MADNLVCSVAHAEAPESMAQKKVAQFLVLSVGQKTLVGNREMSLFAVGLWAMICVRDPNYPGCALRPGQCAEIDAVEICVPPRWGGRR